MNKESFPLKVLHTADIQIEVRNQHQRADEYRFILEHLYQELKAHQCNLYFIVGDIFETCRPNDIEREIFIEHLKKVVQIESLKEIVITYGNHDVDQRQEFNYFLNGGEKTPAPNSLDTIVTAIASPKIMLLDRSTVYHSNAYPSLVYYNWSQKTKHSGILDELKYGIPLLALREAGSHLGTGIRHIQSAGIDDIIHILDIADLVRREPSAAESHDIDTGIRYRVTAAQDVRRYVLVYLGTAAYHCMFAYLGELMCHRASSEDSPVIDIRLPCNPDIAHENAVLTHRAVVGDMGI